MAKKKTAPKKAAKKTAAKKTAAKKKAAKKKAAKKSAKAAKSRSTNTARPLSSARARSGPFTNGHAERHAPTLPESGVSRADIETFVAAAGLGFSQVMDELQKKILGAIDDVQDQNERLLATTAETRNKAAGIEVSLGEALEKLGTLVENQRQPEPAPDRERAAAMHAIRVLFARQMVALNIQRPTPAIVGRVMRDGRAFDPSSAKSPHEIFDSICKFVRVAFPIPAASSEESADGSRDHVHLDEKMVALLEGQSSLPKRKHSEYLDKQLKPRLKVLVNQRLARADKQEGGRHYDRYLTEEGQIVFEDWPNWDDPTGGVGLADDRSIPSESS